MDLFPRDLHFFLNRLQRTVAPQWRLFLCGVIVAAVTGCSIYFNTFYNAETAFREGYTVHAKALRNYPDSLVVEPPPEARSKYDRAIEKSAKVLDVFPKDKKWHDDALFLLGKTYYYQKEFGKSLRNFKQLQVEYPGSKYIPESFLYIARDYIGLEDFGKAEETINVALDRYPELDKNQEASLLLVEIAIRREGTARAIGLLEKAQANVRSEEKKQELLVRISELYMGLKDYTKAAALLASAPRSRKDHLRDYRLDRNLVLCRIELDSLDAALSQIKAMLANKLYVPYTKDILFVKGTILAHQGNVDAAIEAFEQVVGNAADSTMSRNDTAQVVGRALYELGLLYQKKKGSYEKAEKYFRKVTERGARDSVIFSRAEKRVHAMKTLSEWRAKIASSDTAIDRQKAHYTVGELFYHDLDEPDSAYTQFLLIAADTAVDSVYTPKSLCMAALIARRDLRDTARSDSLYRLLVERFPGSDYIGQAQREWRPQTPLRTRREEAEASFRAAEKTWLYGNDVKGAVQKFFSTYKQYPDLDIAPKSLYVAAWLTDNELQKKKTAKSLYEKLCERYPQSMYCTREAQPRLKTVIDTLEALRRLRKGQSVDSTRLGSAMETVGGRGGAAPGDSGAASAAAALDDAAALGFDSTAAPAAVTPPQADTGDAFSRRPGYRGNMRIPEKIRADSSLIR